VTRYANVSERTVRAWIHAPIAPLPAVQVRGKILVRRTQLDIWLEAHRIKPVDTLDLDAIVKEVLQRRPHGR